ncbi:MAG: NAD(P)H-binding protein [Actinomycetes bacterium]|nr:MAG: NmrA family transcriptional regulator [Actinomycetota bacterium]
MESDTLTLVLGGTGKTGRRVAERLRARGRTVRVGSRAGSPPFDWDDPGTWPAALSGAAAVYLTYQPDLAVPGAAERIADFARLAARSGVRRVVMLSGRGEAAAHAAEQGVRESGMAWTVLRSAWFHQNFSEGPLAAAVGAGELALPAGEVAEPFVDAGDIADVAVAALTADGHAGRTYELTGPRLLTFAEAAAELGRAIGRPVRYRPVSAAEFEAAAAAELPAAEARLLAELFTTTLDGRNAYLTDDVPHLLGRPGTDFAAYARRAAASGAWG